MKSVSQAVLAIILVCSFVATPVHAQAPASEPTTLESVLEQFLAILEQFQAVQAQLASSAAAETTLPNADANASSAVIVDTPAPAPTAAPVAIITDAVSTDQFVVIKSDEVVLERPASELSRQEAQTDCEAIAYNTDNMWERISCTYGDEVLYEGVFIAG